MLALAVEVPQALPGDGGWPMRGGNPQNTGVTNYRGIRKGKAAWTKLGFVGPDAMVPGHPSIAADGTIYVCGYNVHGSGRCDLFALRRDGSIKWHVPMRDSQGRNVAASQPPAIGPSGTIYVGWASGPGAPQMDAVVLFAFDSSGEVLWRFEPNIVQQFAYGMPVVSQDETIYIPLGTGFTAEGDEHGSLFAMDGRTGAVKWRFVQPRRDHNGGSATLDSSGRVFLRSVGYLFEQFGSLYCLDALTGTLVWDDYPNNGGGEETSTAGADGSVYAPAYEGSGRLAKFDAEGNQIWTYRISGSIASSVATEGSRVYVPYGTATQGRSGLHVLDAGTGELLDTFGAGQYCERVVIGHDKRVYANLGNNIVVMDPSGRPLWQGFMFNSTNTTIAVGQDGFILCSTGSRLDAFESAVTLGDMNCDGTVNVFDIDPFVTCLSDKERYLATFPQCEDWHIAADLNVDSTVNLFDIQPFIEKLSNP